MLNKPSEASPQAGVLDFWGWFERKLPKKYTMEVKTVKARKSDKVVYKWMEQKAPRFGTNIDRP